MLDRLAAYDTVAVIKEAVVGIAAGLKLFWIADLLRISDERG